MSADPVVVVGSGASGVHFAWSVLAAGRRVILVDVGRSGDEPRHLDADLTELRRRLDDPFDHFLGPNYESLILPGRDDEYYGFPPGKAHVFQGLDGHEIDARGFAPLLSYARGGLAEAWTGGSYAFDDRELRDFPFAPEALRAGYARVAERIGITGAADDLQRFFPVPDADHETPPPLDAHAARLLANYESHRERLNARDSFYLGRARLALLGADRGRRRACDELGRCLWGCPIGALWTPSWTLGDLEHHERFEYRPGLVAQRFESDDGGRVQRLVVRPSAGGAESAIDVGTLVLCAGTLATARIVLETARRESGSAPELRGLMDNRQVLMPFVSPKMVGRRFEAASYQYHALACALDLGGPEDYVHGLITTLKTALIHPIVATLPLSMRGSLRYFRNLHAALGLVNVNFSDGPRDDNRVALEGEGAHARLFVRYAPPPGEAQRLADATGRLRRILKRLGAVAPRSMQHTRPMGASVHYAGTLPMSHHGGDFTTHPDGRVRPFQNLICADGSVLPWLPAKNLTFSLMANATRIAELHFGPPRRER